MKRLLLILCLALLAAPASAQYDGTTRGMKLISDSVAQDGTWNITAITVGTLTVTSQTILGAGSAGTPILIGPDADSGLFFVSNKAPAFAVDGTRVLQTTAQGINVGSSGTSWITFYSNANFGKIGDDHIGAFRSTNANTLSVAGTYTDSSNNTLLSAQGSANGFRLTTQESGTGTGSATRGLVGIIGSKVVALTESSATTIGTVAVADGAPFLGKAIYGAFCSDGTDFVARTGEITAACVAKAGTVTCSEYTTVDSTDAASGGASFSAFTLAFTEGSNVVDLTLNATCSLTQTTLDAYVTWRNLTTNTVTPGT